MEENTMHTLSYRMSIYNRPLLMTRSIHIFYLVLKCMMSTIIHIYLIVYNNLGSIFCVVQNSLKFELTTASRCKPFPCCYRDILQNVAIISYRKLSKIEPLEQMCVMRCARVYCISIEYWQKAT